MTIIYIIIVLAVVFFAYGREKTWTLFFGQADMGAVDFVTLVPSKNPIARFSAPRNIAPMPNAKPFHPFLPCQPPH